MVPIYICEDSAVQRRQFERVIQNFVMINQLDSQIVLATESANELVSVFTKRKDEFAIVFLDIELAGIERSGIEVANELKQLQPAIKIIFISSHDEFALDIHKLHIEAYDFIQKADPAIVRENIEQVLTELLRNKKNDLQSNEIVKLAFDDEIRFYPLSDIQYFCTIPGQPHKLEAHLANETFQFYGKLKQLTERNPALIRSHRAYVVNVNNIRSINKKEKTILLANDEKIPVSLAKIKQFV